MSKKCKLEKMKKTPKFKVRHKNRCPLCGTSACLHAEVQYVPYLLP